MNFTYSTSTGDVAPSIAVDQPSDVSTSNVAVEFDTEALIVARRAPTALQSKLAELERASSAETSQSSTSLVGTGRELPSAVPDAMANNWVSLAKSKTSGKMGKIYGRILRLAQEAESPGRVALRTGSFRTFLSFWKTVGVLAPEPEVTIARNGNLIAEWHKRWNRHLDVEFKEDGMVLYGLFIGSIVSEGRESAASLARRLIENGRWLV